MKNYILFILFTLCLTSCLDKNKTTSKIEEIPVIVEVSRLDKEFFETPVTDLPKLKAKYPDFFPNQIPDSSWTNKMSNPMWKELYQEVQKKYGDFSTSKQEIETLFSHIKYYFPKTTTPKVVTLIYEMDTNYKTIYNEGLVIISLEMYLGKNHKFYEFPEYIKQSFEPNQILPDIVQEFSKTKVKPPVDKDFISQMIYAGKQMYLKDILLPEYADEDKIGYTKQKLEWAKANEAEIWRYFIDSKLLYDTDSKLAQRFLAPAPFSKFGLAFDSESPGRIGAFMGWQIVKSYLENNDTNVQELMVLDAKEIFQKSKYKPAK
jgi:gliding motility-associated lipoprotein GldB